MTSFGAALRQARENLGFSTQDVALRTKIRGDYLLALENGNLSALPERTFARSYLGRYARELGLDPAPLLADFDRVMPAPAGSAGPRTPARPARSRVSTSPRRGRGPLLALLGVALLGAALGGYVLQSRAAPTATDPSATTVTPDTTPAARTVRLTVKVTPPGARVYLDNRDLGAAPVLAFPADARTQAELRVELAGRQALRQTVDLSRSRDLRVILKPTGTPSVLSDAAQVAPARPTAARPSAPQASAAQTSPPQGTGTSTSPAKPAAQTAPAVKITYSGPSWTRVTDAGGRIVFEGTPAAGTVKTFAAGVTIRTGNAAAVNVSVNGAPGQPLGQAGQVVTRTF